jgi:tellurite resistance protein
MRLRPLDLVSRLVQAAEGTIPSDEGAPFRVLALSAASFGARPAPDATVPTGFDPMAVSLFEAIVETAYLVAAADGHVDDAERRAFETLVVTACGGIVPPRQVTALVADLADQVSEDGLERRIEVLARMVPSSEHRLELLRVAALLALSSEGIGKEEQGVLDRLLVAFALPKGSLEQVLSEVETLLRDAALPEPRRTEGDGATPRSNPGPK